MPEELRRPATPIPWMALTSGTVLLLAALALAIARPASAGMSLVPAAAAGVLAVWSAITLRRRSRRAGAAADQADREWAAVAHRLEEELAARDSVLAAMSEGVWLFDASGNLAYANHAARRIIGRRVDSMAEVSPRALREAILGVRDQPGALSETIQFETADAFVEATALSARSPGTVVVVLRDITRARSVERLRRDFVANASHELKTPVASILALSGALRAAADDDRDAESRFLSRLEHEAHRLAALVRDLLELSRLETGIEERASVRLDRVVSTGAERARWRAEDAGLQLHVEAGSPLLVSGSEGELTHLVENLLDNAVRYTPDGGSIRVSAFPTAEGAELAVEDTGIGISSRDIDRIFERFYRADSARSRETGGTGLGLSIVRHIAESHGGSVECRSILGGGSTFIVRIPLIGRC